MKDWNAAPILSARNLTRRYGEHIGWPGVPSDPPRPPLRGAYRLP